MPLATRHTDTPSTNGTMPPLGLLAAFVAPSLDTAARADQREAAKARYDEAREAGREQGYADGLARAQAEVAEAARDHRRARERFAFAAAALESAAGDLYAQDAVALESIEHDIVSLALELATEIVGHELRSVDEPVRDALRRAIGLVPDRGEIVCRVHPDDADVARSLGHDRVAIVADDTIEAGGCVVEAGECRIDTQVGPAIERMRAALGA
jgi:flagellar assembly protein FliH